MGYIGHNDVMYVILANYIAKKISNARAHRTIHADTNDLLITPGQINMKIIFKPAPVPAMSATPQRNSVAHMNKCITKGKDKQMEVMRYTRIPRQYE